MKQHKKLTACLLCATLCAVQMPVCTLSTAAAADDHLVYDAESGVTYNTQDDWLHVEGDKIVDVDGNEVWLTGCNWFGYNVGSQVFDGVWSQNMHDMLRQIADHGFNLLRVPVSTELLLQWKNGDPDPATPKVNQYSNPELTVEGVAGGTIMYSFDIWNKALQWCRQLGIKIMIDIHSAETASAGHQVNLWYTDKFSTQDWCDALYWFADYYKNDDTILAIDLKNEPHGKADTPDIMARWDDTTDPQNWKHAAETAASYVMQGNPNLLVMVEGIEVYPKEGYDWTAPAIDYTTMTEFYHGAWWGGNFRGAREYPIDLGEHQSQLVYSPHDYGPLVYNQTWFDKDFTTQTLLDDYWYDTWAFLCEEHIAPLLMGEWGGFIDAEHDADGKNTRWLTLLRDYMIEHHIHHTFWCFNENSGDTGGLVYDNFGKWDEDKYALVREALWQDANGTFISLDHAVALGQNGQSLSSYYGGGSGTQIGSDDNLYGDVDVNGEVTLADAITLTRFIAEDPQVSLSSVGKVNADVTGDDTIDSQDAVLILRYLAKLIPLEDLNPHPSTSSGTTTQEPVPDDPFYVEIVLTDEISPVLNLEISGKHYTQETTDFAGAEAVVGETIYNGLSDLTHAGDTLIRIPVPYSVGNMGNLTLNVYGNVGEGSGVTFGIICTAKLGFVLCAEGKYQAKATFGFDGASFTIME